MDTLKNILALFAFVFILSTRSSNAGVLAEPYLGLSLGAGGDARIDYKNIEYSFSAATYGTRIGYQYLGFMAGLDYSFQKFRMTKEGPGIAKKLDTKKNQWGVFAGYNFPLLIRAWGTFFVSSKIDGESEVFKKGMGYELGIGSTTLPFVSLNISYRTLTYDRYIAVGNPVYNEKLVSHELLFSASLPLELFD